MANSGENNKNKNLTLGDIEQLYHAINESVFRGSAMGSFYGQYQALLRGIDRYHSNILPANSEMTGLTFITRPKLNLTTTSIRQDRVTMSLDTNKVDSLAFTIRCLLDRKYANRPDIKNLMDQNKGAFLDNRSPFITPLTNCLIGMSGWPDYIIDTETTEGGYHSENLTFAKGSDRLSGSYDLSLTFRDVQGGFILALLYIWIKYIDLVTKGTVVPYTEDIELRRLCYTCSIYRFVLDPSKRYITKWAKATGCFPKSVPLGPAFNINEHESFISATSSYSIPYTANKIEYMDPIILQEFNMLMKRSCPAIDTSSMVTVPTDAYYNYRGLPYIDTFSGKNEIIFKATEDELKDPLDNLMEKLESKLNEPKEVIVEPIPNVPKDDTHTNVDGSYTYGR